MDSPSSGGAARQRDGGRARPRLQERFPRKAEGGQERGAESRTSLGCGEAAQPQLSSSSSSCCSGGKAMKERPGCTSSVQGGLCARIPTQRCPEPRLCGDAAVRGTSGSSRSAPGNGAELQRRTGAMVPLMGTHPNSGIGRAPAPSGSRREALPAGWGCWGCPGMPGGRPEMPEGSQVPPGCPPGQGRGLGSSVPPTPAVTSSPGRGARYMRSYRCPSFIKKKKNREEKKKPRAASTLPSSPHS